MNLSYVNEEEIVVLTTEALEGVEKGKPAFRVHWTQKGFKEVGEIKIEFNERFDAKSFKMLKPGTVIPRYGAVFRIFPIDGKTYYRIERIILGEAADEKIISKEVKK